MNSNKNPEKSEKHKLYEGYRKQLGQYRQMLASCSGENEAEVAELFTRIGHLLLRLGLKEQALSSWRSSLRLQPAHEVREKVLELLNQYGMIRCGSRREDDFKAFASVQIGKYLSRKSKRCFGTLAEADMVMDLISDYWYELERSERLMRMDCSDKVFFFREIRIEFPICNDQSDQCIAYDFRGRRVMEPGDSCHCESGLPYYACCGAIVDPADYINGLK